MRDPRNALRPFLVKETKTACERLAGELFRLDNVRDAITDAAMRGEGAVRLTLGEATAELRQTEAAGKLVAWCKDNGLRLEWTERILDRPNGLRLRTAEAVIIWVDETLSS